jgi:hypothetical protein
LAFGLFFFFFFFSLLVESFEEARVLYSYSVMVEE